MEINKLDANLIVKLILTKLCDFEYIQWPEYINLKTHLYPLINNVVKLPNIYEFENIISKSLSNFTTDQIELPLPTLVKLLLRRIKGTNNVYKQFGKIENNKYVYVTEIYLLCNAINIRIDKVNRLNLYHETNKRTYRKKKLN